MPSPSAPRTWPAAALVGIALLGGCSVSPSPVDAGPTSQDAVDVVVLDEHRTAYLGDASSVGALAEAIGVSSLGERTIALSTDSRPYAVTIDFTSLADRVTPDRADQVMTDRAALLLATIGNADEIRWRLPGDQAAVKVLTRAAADERAGAPVAELGATADGLERLVKRLQG